jgi:hypothetical protein
MSTGSYLKNGPPGQGRPAVTGAETRGGATSSTPLLLLVRSGWGFSRANSASHLVGLRCGVSRALVSAGLVTSGTLDGKWTARRTDAASTDRQVCSPLFCSGLFSSLSIFSPVLNDGVCGVPALGTLLLEYVRANMQGAQGLAARSPTPDMASSIIYPAALRARKGQVL